MGTVSYVDAARLVETLPKDPYLDEGMRGFILSTASREYWRVSELCDLVDLVQDGCMLYFKCRKRYVEPRADLTASVDDRRWFQSLVKTAFYNHISTLAAKHKGVSVRPASEFVVEGEDGAPSDIFEEALPPSPELGTLAALLIKAPSELKELVQLLAGDGAQGLAFARRKVGRRSVRETTNEFYCRILRLNPQERNIVAELRNYFGVC